MRSYQIKRKNNIIIGTLCAVVLLMVVGYAAFSSVLNIKGTSGISSNWDIEITNIRGGNPDGGDAYDISEPTYTPTTATFSTGLKTPGTMRVYEVEVTNKGTLEGLVTIASLSCGDNEAIGCDASVDKEKIVDENWELLDYDLSNEQFFEQGQQDYSDIEFTLAPGEKHYLYIGVYYENVESQPENISTNIKLELTYEQAIDGGDGNKIPNRPIFNGTIDELKENIVTIGSGLYTDEYEEGRYVYKGLKPNNYIKFNDELWRIIAFESDGTVKIMKNERLTEMKFDETNSNDWARPATVNTYLNDTYYNGLEDSQKNKIVQHEFNVGVVESLYGKDLTVQIENEKSKKWNGNIGLITASDFIKANSDMEKCGSAFLYGEGYDRGTRSNICLVTNWIGPILSMVNSDNSYANQSIATINPLFDFPGSSITYISIYGLSSGDYSSYKFSIFPVTHLKSDIILKGSGTQTDPYVIVE